MNCSQLSGSVQDPRRDTSSSEQIQSFLLRVFSTETEAPKPRGSGRNFRSELTTETTGVAEVRSRSSYLVGLK